MYLSLWYLFTCESNKESNKFSKRTNLIILELSQTDNIIGMLAAAKYITLLFNNITS